MPAFEVRDLYQRALLWPAVGVDAFGQIAVGPPVEIAIRWITNRQQVQDPKGGTITLAATAVVAQVVPIGSHMWLAPPGTKVGYATDAWYNSGSAGIPNELCMVKMFMGTPDLKNRAQRTTLGLMKLHDSSGD